MKRISSFHWLIGVVALSSCTNDAARRDDPPAPKPVAVHVASVSAAQWRAAYEATGTVRAPTASGSSATRDSS